MIGDTATHAGVGGVCCILDWINLNCGQGGKHSIEHTGRHTGVGIGWVWHTNSGAIEDRIRERENRIYWWWEGDLVGVCICFYVVLGVV